MLPPSAVRLRLPCVAVVFLILLPSRAAIGTCPDFTIRPAGGGPFPFSVLVADFDGDGKADLAYTNVGLGRLSVLLGRGDGTFSGGSSISDFGVLSVVQPIASGVGDFNGDGKLDLVVRDTYSNHLFILIGNGNGSFAAPVAYTIPGGFVDSDLGRGAVADFNNDGKSDLVISAYGTLRIMLGNGDGTLAAPTDVGSGGGLVMADFNGDGKPDLAVVSNKVSILLSNGNGTFTSAGNYSAGDTPSDVATGDFNGDGKTDLVVSNYPSNIVSILLGNGDGTFTGPVNYPAGNWPLSVAVADFNGDGKTDIVVTNHFDKAFSILLGNGNGTFSAPLSYATPEIFPSNLAVGDFNSDGRIDLVVAMTYTTGLVTLFLNNPNCLAITSISPTVGAVSGGQNVTITGSGLAGATSVTFGGTPATITANAASSITVIVPAHAAGVVDIVVTTPNGTATLTAAYLYSASIPTLSEWMIVILAAVLGGIGTLKLRS
jgi:VCBS repeat protein/IPT/TIG domain-containing protein/exosortase sorting signal-containing protein